VLAGLSLAGLGWWLVLALPEAGAGVWTYGIGAAGTKAIAPVPKATVISRETRGKSRFGLLSPRLAAESAASLEQHHCLTLHQFPQDKSAANSHRP